MNLIIIPFHDWRKILKEGFRTRDAHFIEELSKNKNIVKVIINRPTTLLEINIKRKSNLIKKKIILKKTCFGLYEIENNLFLIDYVSYDILGQIVNSFEWFVEQYSNPNYIAFINEALAKLGIQGNYNLVNQNIFAFKISESLKPKISVFDAWDNFNKFRVYSKILNTIEYGYNSYAKTCDFWTTNSKDNIIFFSKKYNPKSIFLIKNGVDASRFANNDTISIPKDMRRIPRPIVGFGGKITHLIDVKLLNETMKITKEFSFVMVGQILDKQVFNEISKLDNFYYLGDKHYDIYPDYVKNFDICIVPYVVEDDKKSGANTIKVYEYLATNKKVIGTNSNGLEDLEEYLYIINDAEEFSSVIRSKQNNKQSIKPFNHSWNSKITKLLNLLEKNHED